MLWKRHRPDARHEPRPCGQRESRQQAFLLQDPDGYLLRLTRYRGERPAGSTQ